MVEVEEDAYGAVRSARLESRCPKSTFSPDENENENEDVENPINNKKNKPGAAIEPTARGDIENKIGSGDKDERKVKKQTWVVDRTNGKSKVGEGRPPLPCCWVPPPVGKCPGVLEQNCFCEAYGKLGLVDADNARSRRILMSIGLVSSTIALVLTAVACGAVSEKFDILKASAFTRGVMNTTTNFTRVKLHIGLRAVALEDTIQGDITVNFDQFCALSAPDASQDFVDKIKYLKLYLKPSECGACDAVSTNLVTSVFMSLLTCLPTIFSDVTRMYHNYDVNCQKVFATLVSFVGAMLSLNTLLQYSNKCFRAFFDGSIPFDSQYNILSTQNASQATAYGTFEWTAGPGYVCLIIATLMKFVDIIVHMLLPTPSITRNREEQSNYEKMERTSIE